MLAGAESVLRDKFLVMAMQVKDVNVKSSALAQLWKKNNKNVATYMEHRYSEIHTLCNRLTGILYEFTCHYHCHLFVNGGIKITLAQ